MIQELIGFTAGVGTTFSFIPQVLKVYKDSNIEGLSIHMMMIHFSGVSLWIIYGILKHDNIIISFNSITLLAVMSIICKYIQVKRQMLP
jgi:MtN3 and saliva related transmembrane protein